MFYVIAIAYSGLASSFTTHDYITASATFDAFASDDSISYVQLGGVAAEMLLQHVAPMQTDIALAAQIMGQETQARKEEYCASHGHAWYDFEGQHVYCERCAAKWNDMVDPYDQGVGEGGR